jgi:hypothetical protein
MNGSARQTINTIRQNKYCTTGDRNPRRRGMPAQAMMTTAICAR